jgi:hypothetical protein
VVELDRIRLHLPILVRSADDFGAAHVDTDDMTGWTARVEEPFRSDRRFWQSVVASIAALVAVVATALAVTLGGSRLAFLAVLPVVLLVVAAGEARASTSQTRPQFATRTEWREAERRAVAAALGFGGRR